MFSRLIFGTAPPMAESDHLVGALIITVAVMAMAEVVARALRLINVAFGLWLIAAPWLLSGPHRSHLGRASSLALPSLHSVRRAGRGATSTMAAGQVPHLTRCSRLSQAKAASDITIHCANRAIPSSKVGEFGVAAVYAQWPNPTFMLVTVNTSPSLASARPHREPGSAARSRETEEPFGSNRVRRGREGTGTGFVGALPRRLERRAW